MKTFKRLPLVKEMITQLVVCEIITILKTLIAIDLTKQQALDADPKAIQQINFTANLDRDGQTAMYFIIQEIEETTLDFSQGTVKVL